MKNPSPQDARAGRQERYPTMEVLVAEAVLECTEDLRQAATAVR
jgi:hypothetical protein